MITIHVRFPSDRPASLEHTWLIGDKGSQRMLNDLPFVESVTVDGDELIWLLEQRTDGLPRLAAYDGLAPYGQGKRFSREPHTWFGDHAKFIIANICLKDMA